MTSTTNQHKLEECARRMVQRDFSLVPQKWAALAAEHLDRDEYVAMPMWGYLFVVQDSCAERSIQSLMLGIRIPDEYMEEATEEYRAGNIPEYAAAPTQDHGITHEEKTLAYEIIRAYTGLDLDADEDNDEVEAEFDTIKERARELWAESNSEEYELASSGWQAVGDTGVIAREFDGNLCLGVNGCGYDFYEAHWIPLYLAMGLTWHE
jgi:hypothetical protein